MILLILACQARADDWVGPAEAVDGTTLIIGKNRLRLAQIEPVDVLCERHYNVMPCGDFARQTLARLIKDKQVTCSGASADWHRVPRVNCRAGAVDLNRQMVLDGWAKADQSNRYRAEQDLAMSRRDGFWMYDPYPSGK